MPIMFEVPSEKIPLMLRKIEEIEEASKANGGIHKDWSDYQPDNSVWEHRRFTRNAALAVIAVLMLVGIGGIALMSGSKWTWFVAGCFVGGNLAVIGCGLLAAARDN